MNDPAVPWVEFRFTQDSEEDYKDHFHLEFFLGAVTSGVATGHSEGRDFPVAAGSLVHFCPNVVHRCNPETRSRTYVVALISPDWALQLQQDVLGGATGWQIPTAATLDDPTLFQRFLKLATLFEDQGSALEKTEGLILYLGDFFLRLAEQPAISPLPASRIISDLKERLGRNLEENLTLPQIADELGGNPYHLLRSFKKTVGITPHAYRLNLRIEMAKEMLRDGEPPAQVATATGFVDQSHFHRTFRQIVSATPGEFQRRK